MTRDAYKDPYASYQGSVELYNPLCGPDTEYTCFIDSVGHYGYTSGPAACHSAIVTLPHPASLNDQSGFEGHYIWAQAGNGTTRPRVTIKCMQSNGRAALIYMGDPS